MKLYLPLAAAVALLLPFFADAAEPLPLAHPVRGEPFAAKLAGIDPEWNISLAADGKERVLAVADLALWGSYRDASTGPQLLLADGSVIVADVLDLGTENVALGDASGLGRVFWNESAIPLRQLTAILYQPSADSLERDKQLEKLASGDRKEDQVWLTSGEVLSGRIVSLPHYGRFLPPAPPPQAEVLKLSRRGVAEPLSIPLARVTAIVFNAAQSPAIKARPAARLGVKDGSLLAARKMTVEKDQVQVELQGGGALKAFKETGDDAAPTFWDQVTLLQTSSASVAYLSDLPAPAYKQIPFTSLEWPLGVDKNVLGGRLRSGETVALRGLGMHSASRVAFDLKGEQRFEAQFALDDQSATRGSVIGKVLLETEPGKWTTAYESPVVRGADAPLSISVPLKGARRLALLVEFADRGDEWDHANWLNARLVR
ncbi:MAG: NPCBM/NEW2 domain-containing protein [Planctomycetales bacterium]|nr:NPCBM/NEW2 domain-containing protein [Planctomycetales bacterium]